MDSDHQTTADHWAVTVRRNGEEIVTIESNSLAGREISPEDEKAIETAAHHLLSFIGRSPFLPLTMVGASDGRMYRLNDHGLWEHADAG